MAVDYTNLFENVGEFVQRINEYRTLLSDFDTDFSEIEADLDANGAQNILSGTFEIFENQKSSVLGWIDILKGKVEQLLSDRTTILEQINLPEGTDIQAILRALYRDMVDNTQTVETNTVGTGAITKDCVNSDAGTLMVDTTLDGVNAPATNASANWEYRGVISELADDDTIYAQCILDSESDGVAEGSEVFQLDGRPQRTHPFSIETHGSGSGPQIAVLQGASLLTNLEFEDFDDDTPDGWTVSAGVAGVTILEETSTVHRGDSALEFVGDGATQHSITQVVPAGVFVPGQRYCLGLWIRGDATIAGGALEIMFSGGGYTAASSEKITMNAAALAAATSYTWKHFYITWPDEVDEDNLLLLIQFTSPLTAAKSVFIDGGGIAPVTYFNGANFVIYAGAEKFLRRDRLSTPLSNNDAGVFQTFFRKAFGVQLPSDGSPSQADSLAT
jgi:hypothetical protein